MGNEDLVKYKNCAINDFCTDCLLGPLRYQICSGCDYAYSKRCLKRYCNFRCSYCGAGKKYFEGVFGICGRNNLSRYNRFINIQEVFNYKIKGDFPLALPIQTIFIPVLYKEARKYNIPEQFPAIDAWVIQFHDVFNLRSKTFVSNDMKDYFSIDESKKIILSTNSPDNYQEILWDKRFSLDFTTYNFDYWFPGHFSIYDDDNKFYHFVNAKRQKIHAELSGSQFIWFRLGENIPLEFMHDLKEAKNILISTNNMDSDSNKKVLQAEVTLADEFFPLDASFFIVGGASSLPRLRRDRKYYIIGTTWCKNALSGHDIHNKIHKKYEKNEKKEMLNINLREAINDARENYNELYGRRSPGGSRATQRRLAL